MCISSSAVELSSLSSADLINKVLKRAVVSLGLSYVDAHSS